MLTNDYRALSAPEKAAFTRYFQESLWEDRFQDKTRPEYYEHLNDDEWLEARRVFFEQDYSHFIRALKGGLTVTTQREKWLPEQTRAIRLRQYEGGRLEAEIPLSALRSMLETSDQNVEAGPFVLRTLEDGSLLLEVDRKCK